LTVWYIGNNSTSQRFEKCKFNNYSFDFDSKLYKSLKKSDDNDEYKHEIVNAKNEKMSDQNNTNDWSELKDPNTGATYYWNEATNETRWEKP